MSERSKDEVKQAKEMTKRLARQKEVAGGLIATNLFVIMIVILPLVPHVGFTGWLVIVSMMGSYLLADLIQFVVEVKYRVKGKLYLYHRYFGFVGAIIAGTLVSLFVQDWILSGLNAGQFWAYAIFVCVTFGFPYFLFYDLLVQLGRTSPRKLLKRIKWV